MHADPNDLICLHFIQINNVSLKNLQHSILSCLLLLVMGVVVAISRNGAERNRMELRSKIWNRTGLTECSFLSCTSQKRVADHLTVSTM